MNNGIPQLKELVFRYCNHGGSSRGIRAFIKERLMKFAEKNSHVQMQTLNKNGKHPIVIGKYICGNEKVFDVKNCDAIDVLRVAYRLRDMSGRKSKKFEKAVYTWRPSIQGYWDSDTDYQVQMMNDVQSKNKEEDAI